MKWNRRPTRVIVLGIIFAGILSSLAGCAPSQEKIKAGFYSYPKMLTEVTDLAARYPQLLTVFEQGRTYEGRTIIILAIGPKDGAAGKPEIMAVFAQHSGEHATTNVAMGFVNQLLSNYGKDEEITRILNEKRIYIVPMANPDGVEYSMTNEKIFYQWRKNRKPVGLDSFGPDPERFGVDLNRNWGYQWDAPVGDELASHVSSPNNQYFHGEKPFSELETIALRDFIVGHKNIKLFVDYHAGESNYMQGDIIIPFCYTDDREVNRLEMARYEEFRDMFARTISDPADHRTPFTALNAYQVREFVLKNTPLLLKPFVRYMLPASTLAPGSAIDWAANQGIFALGVEILSKDNFAAKMPHSQERLTKKQFEGFLFLLQTL